MFVFYFLKISFEYSVTSDYCPCRNEYAECPSTCCCCRSSDPSVCFIERDPDPLPKCPESQFKSAHPYKDYLTQELFCLKTDRRLVKPQTLSDNFTIAINQSTNSVPSSYTFGDAILASQSQPLFIPVPDPSGNCVFSRTLNFFDSTTESIYCESTDFSTLSFPTTFLPTPSSDSQSIQNIPTSSGYYILEVYGSNTTISSIKWTQKSSFSTTNSIYENVFLYQIYFKSSTAQAGESNKPFGYMFKQDVPAIYNSTKNYDQSFCIPLSIDPLICTPLLFQEDILSPLPPFTDILSEWNFYDYFPKYIAKYPHPSSSNLDDWILISYKHSSNIDLYNFTGVNPQLICALIYQKAGRVDNPQPYLVGANCQIFSSSDPGYISLTWNESASIVVEQYLPPKPITLPYLPDDTFYPFSSTADAGTMSKPSTWLITSLIIVTSIISLL